MGRVALTLFFAFASIIPSLAVKPTFSWDTMPVFAHVRYANFSDAQIEYLSQFAMITIQPWVPQPFIPGEEQCKIVRQRVQAIKPTVPVALYVNVRYSSGLYDYDKIFLAHPDWCLIDPSTKKCFGPAGRVDFDFTNDEVVTFWASIIANATVAGEADGGYGDSGCGGHVDFLSDEQNAKFAAGSLRAQTLAQEMIGDKATMVANCPYTGAPATDYPVGAGGVMYESWCSDFAAPHTTKGKAVYCRNEMLWTRVLEKNNTIMQARYYLNKYNNYNPYGGMASFLIAAYPGAYFGASVNWNLDGDWDKWPAGYSKPLGAPTGEPQMLDKYGCAWKRVYKSAVVSTNYCSPYANIAWGNSTVNEDGLAAEAAMVSAGVAVVERDGDTNPLSDKFVMRPLGQKPACASHEGSVLDMHGDLMCVSTK